MSKKNRRVQVVYDQGFSKSGSYTPSELRGVKAHPQLQFTDGGTVHVDPDEADFKRKMAMLYAKRDKEARPWCPICNVHKVGRVGKGMDAPLDHMCTACGKASAAHGPKKTFEYHMAFCGWCGRKKEEKPKQDGEA